MGIFYPDPSHWSGWFISSPDDTPPTAISPLKVFILVTVRKMKRESDFRFSVNHSVRRGVPLYSL